jgi:hypothetical protein
VSDKLLRVVLEDGALADDESMQERWANLLATGATSPQPIATALTSILNDLEPIEARLLDAICDCETGRVLARLLPDEIDPNAANMDNLERLGVIRFEAGTAATWGDLANMDGAPRKYVAPTELGRALVGACRSPVAAI